MGASAARADALQRRLSTRGLSLSSVREHASGEALQRDLASARAEALQRSPPEVLRALSLMEDSVAEESAAEEAEQVEEEAEAATGLSSLFSPLRGSQVSSLFSPLQSEAAVATTGQAEAEAEAAAGLTSLFSPLRGAKGGTALAATTTPRRRRAVAGQAEAEAELARLKAELAV